MDALDAGGGVTKLASPTAARPNTFTINAANEGSRGKQIVLNVSHESAGRAVLDAWISGVAGNNQFKMKSTANFHVNAWVEIDRGNVKFYRIVLAVNGLVVTLDGPALAAADVAPQLAAPNDVTYFNTTEFRLTAAYGGQTEQFPGLALENVPGRYYRTAMTGLIIPQSRSVKPVAPKRRRCGNEDAVPTASQRLARGSPFKASTPKRQVSKVRILVGSGGLLRIQASAICHVVVLK